MNKNLVFMRTHYLNDAVISEYSKLYSSLNREYDCILFVDNHANFLNITSDSNPLITIKINNKSINSLVYNKTIHDELQLPYYTETPYNEDLGSVMWYCSDYPLYIVRKYFPDYDYYWSFENDVFCNGNSYKKFFKNHCKDNSDLIISHYRSTDNEDWFWKYKTEWCGYNINEIYGCLFPVVRISAKAIDFLYQKRLNHANRFKSLLENNETNFEDNNRWIFCEAFVATELTNNNFKCKLLDEPYLRYLPVYNLNVERIFEKPDFRLYHPVK